VVDISPSHDGNGEAGFKGRSDPLN
jgi:hypothetical protein